MGIFLPEFVIWLTRFGRKRYSQYTGVLGHTLEKAFRVRRLDHKERYGGHTRSPDKEIACYLSLPLFPIYFQSSPQRMIDTVYHHRLNSSNKYQMWVSLYSIRFIFIWWDVFYMLVSFLSGKIMHNMPYFENDNRYISFVRLKIEIFYLPIEEKKKGCLQTKNVV